MGGDRIECKCSSQLSITDPECSCTEKINARGEWGERSLLQVHTLGKHPLFQPSPKHPPDLTTPTPCQKDLVYTHCQLLKMQCTSCLTEFPVFLPVFTVSYPFSLPPPGLKLSKNQLLTSTWSPNKWKALQAELQRAITNHTSCLTYFPRCKSRKRYIITWIKILS